MRILPLMLQNSDLPVLSFVIFPPQITYFSYSFKYCLLIFTYLFTDNFPCCYFLPFQEFPYAIIFHL